MRLWLRFLLWWNNVCPKHGVMDDNGYNHVCRHCRSLLIEEYTYYQDNLRTRWKNGKDL